MNNEYEDYLDDLRNDIIETLQEDFPDTFKDILIKLKGGEQ